MEILYLLVPLSAALVLAILGVFAWALYKGQFEDLEGEAQRILEHNDGIVDDGQVTVSTRLKQSRPSEH